MKLPKRGSNGKHIDANAIIPIEEVATKTGIRN